MKRNPTHRRWIVQRRRRPRLRRGTVSHRRRPPPTTTSAVTSVGSPGSRLRCDTMVERAIRWNSFRIVPPASARLTSASFASPRPSPTRSCANSSNEISSAGAHHTTVSLSDETKGRKEPFAARPSRECVSNGTSRVKHMPPCVFLRSRSGRPSSSVARVASIETDLARTVLVGAPQHRRRLVGREPAAHRLKELAQLGARDRARAVLVASPCRPQRAPSTARAVHSASASERASERQ